MSDVEEPPSRIEKVKKPRAPMSQAQKDTLARGRAKLAEQRQAAKARVLEIEEDPVGAVNRKAEPKKVKKTQKVYVEDDDSEDDVPDIHVIRRRSKPKAPARVTYASDDDDDDDEPEPEPTPRPSRSRTAPVARRPARSAAPRTPPEPAEEPFTVHFF